MKKLGKLHLASEKMLSQNDLLGYRGGSGDNCSNCIESASIACEASCAGGACSWWECFVNQSNQCWDMYC
jgi:hypothetical protein